MDKYILIIILLVLTLWVIPAFLLTVKVRNTKGLSPSFKKQIILPMWFVPLVGNLVCYFIFAKTGKLNKLSADEHRSIWAAAPRK